MNFRAVLGLVVICSSGVSVAAPPPPTAAGPAGSELLTLHVKDQPTDVACERLGKLIGCEIHGKTPDFWDNVSNSPVLVDFDPQPFFEILHELCQEGQLKPVESFQHQVVLAEDRQGTWAYQPYLIRGPIRVAVTNADSRPHPPNVRVAHIEPEFFLQTTLLCDPRVSAIYATPWQVQTIQGDDGKPYPTLKSFGLKAPFEHGVAQFGIHLDQSARNRLIREFKASTEVVVGVRSVKIDIPNLATASTLVRDVEGLKLSFTVQPTGDGVQVGVKTTNPGMASEVWDQRMGGMSHTPPRAFDKQGHPYMIRGGASGIGPRSFQQRWDFTPPFNTKIKFANPDKFTWDIPVAFTVLPVNVEFQNLRPL